MGEIIARIVFAFVWWVLMFPILWVLATPVILVWAWFRPPTWRLSVRALYGAVTDFWQERGADFLPLP